MVEGGDILEERTRSAKETAKRPVGGFVLDGFQGDAMTRELRLKLISSVTAELPDDKPRYSRTCCYFQFPHSFIIRFTFFLQNH